MKTLLLLVLATTPTFASAAALTCASDDGSVQLRFPQSATAKFSGSGSVEFSIDVDGGTYAQSVEKNRVQHQSESVFGKRAFAFQLIGQAEFPSLVLLRVGTENKLSILEIGELKVGGYSADLKDDRQDESGLSQAVIEIRRRSQPDEAWSTETLQLDCQ